MISHILIIDDDKWFLKLTSEILRKNGFRTSTAMSAAEAYASLESGIPDLILLDVYMPDLDGFEVYRHIVKTFECRHTPIIFVTATDDSEVVSKCFEVGGADYIGKPVREYELLARISLHSGLRKRDHTIKEMESENKALKNFLFDADLKNPAMFESIITVNSGMRAIFKYVEAVAKSSRSVLITGETGVGKEMFANVIHRLSNRSGQFITINVAGLDDNLFSDTLFGHEKGAYTGADKAREGLIEKAAGGTLFLDEIGDLNTSSQVKLLRLLQEQEYYALGSDQRKLTDARIIVATNRNLYELAKDEKFREDLYYRLRTHQIHIPPLRERKSDIPILLDHFVTGAARELNRTPPVIPGEFVSLLKGYHFPGNIREFEALVFDAVSRTDGETLSVSTFKDAIGALSSARSDNTDGAGNAVMLEILEESRFPTLKETNEFVINEALRRTGGNQSLAAELLGLSRQALNKRLSRADR